ncbi:MAG: TRAP transporter substrate-binding protein DctP [bacterium]
MKRQLSIVVAVAACLLVAAVSVNARELIYGSWVSPKHGLNRVALPYLFNGVAKDTGGAITWKMVAGGQLANSRGTPKAIRDGVMDAGFGIANYVYNILPATGMIFNTYVFGNDVVAASGAMMETVLLRCPECLLEHRNYNAIPLAGYGAGPYLLMCRKNLTSVADLKGRKVRASGGGVYLMKMAGATPVAMSPAAATTALQRGTLDCVHGAGSWIRSYGYGDVIESILTYPMGINGPAMGMHMNRKTWLSLTLDQKKAHLRYAPDVVARTTIDVYIIETDAIIAGVAAKGVKLNSGGADFDRLMAKYAKSQRATNIKNARKFGLTRADAIMTEFENAVKKWKVLSKDIGRNSDKFAAALWEEVYSKIDPNSL